LKIEILASDNLILLKSYVFLLMTLLPRTPRERGRRASKKVTPIARMILLLSTTLKLMSLHSERALLRSTRKTPTGEAGYGPRTVIQYHQGKVRRIKRGAPNSDGRSRPG
jgi:hypothetical protein